MNKEKVKIFISGLLLITVLMACCVSAAADENVCSLTLNCLVNVDNIDKPVADDNFAVIKIADCSINQSGNNTILDYKTVHRFELFDRRWADVPSSELRMLSKEIAKDVTLDDYSYIKKTDSNGTVSFPLNEPGFYLVIRLHAVDDKISFEPFLISVPQIINNEINFDVVSYPKFEYIINDTDDPERINSDSIRISDTDTDASDGGKNIERLPQTGQMNLPIVVLLCLGIPMIFIGIILITGEKENEEK